MMRTMIKLMAVCLSCILLGSVNAHAAEKSIQEEKSMQVEEVIKKRPYSSLDESYADSHYGCVSYRWKNSGLCIRYIVKDGKLQKKEITLKGKAKKYAKKRNYFMCDWMDAKGNFYFLTYEPRKKNGKLKEFRFLNKVNKKGKLIKRINLNDWLKIDNDTKDPDTGTYSGREAKNQYNLFMERIDGNEVITFYYDGKKMCYVIFDRNTGRVKRQIFIMKNRNPEEGLPNLSIYHKQMQFIVSKDGRLFYKKYTAGKKITLPSGNQIRYQEVKKRKQIGKLPKSTKTEIGERERIFTTWKNHVYLLAPEGYYRINTKNLSIEKLASVSELPFWKNEYSDIEFKTLIVLSKKKCLFGLYNYTNEPDEHVKLLLWQGTVS